MVRPGRPPAIPIPLVISAHIAIPLKEFTPNGGNENPSRLNRASTISSVCFALNASTKLIPMLLLLLYFEATYR